MRWIGPITIDRLLDGALDSSVPRPPIQPSVYVISREPWAEQPTENSEPLYVGGNTSNSLLFRTRIGSLVADMFGFFGGPKGHHSGGQTLYRYCVQAGIDPRELYIGWVEDIDCHRCEENRVYDELGPALNKNRPAKCREHGYAR